MNENKKRIIYCSFAYALFWVALVIIDAIVLNGLLPREGTPFMLLATIGSWTPTIALLILFKKLLPESSIKQFFKNMFREHLNFRLILFISIVQVLVFIGAAFISTFTKGICFLGRFDLSLRTIVLGFIWSIVQGATGEESGWRGFLQQSMEKSFGVLKSSVIVGIIWGFWHMPLWFMSSGFVGKELIQYIIAIIFAICSFSIIIGICYNRCRNIFIPVWMHFMFNFVVTVFKGNSLSLLTWMAVLYFFLAIGYILWFRKCKGWPQSN